MKGENYLRTRFTVFSSRQEGDGSINVILTPALGAGSEARTFKCGGGQLQVIIPPNSDFADLRDWIRGRVFFLDLVPAELAAVVGQG